MFSNDSWPTLIEANSVKKQNFSQSVNVLSPKRKGTVKLHNTVDTLSKKHSIEEKLNLAQKKLNNLYNYINTLKTELINTRFASIVISYKYLTKINSYSSEIQNLKDENTSLKNEIQSLQNEKKNTKYHIDYSERWTKIKDAITEEIENLDNKYQEACDIIESINESQTSEPEIISCLKSKLIEITELYKKESKDNNILRFRLMKASDDNYELSRTLGVVMMTCRTSKECLTLKK